ncbi:hypothetical protein N7540_001093 [Penicillium herquei]|nr:hypothetical protein N7540_001093 [Penicillium herquei]
MDVHIQNGSFPTLEFRPPPMIRFDRSRPKEQVEADIRRMANHCEDLCIRHEDGSLTKVPCISNPATTYDELIDHMQVIDEDIKLDDMSLYRERKTRSGNACGSHKDDEVVEVGDEHGIQGRFQQSIGTVLGHAFKAESMDIQFADFQCLGEAHDKIPDFVLQNSGNLLRTTGELKVPWVEEH